MRGTVAKRLRRAAEAAIEGTDRPWFDSYVENEKMRSHKTAMKYLQNLIPSQITSVLQAGWHTTGPRMYSEGVGKDLYKTMKQTYKAAHSFKNKASKSSIKALLMTAN